jgi:hypothetical protein
MAGMLHLELLTDFFNKIGQQRPFEMVVRLPLHPDGDQTAALH